MVIIDPRTDLRWQQFVENHPDARIFHTTGWLEALRRTYRYPTVVYAATGPGQGLVGGIPFCHVYSRLTGRRLVSLPFSDHCQPLAENPVQLQQLLAAVRNDARKNNCQYVEIKPLTPYASGIAAAAEIGKRGEAVIHRLDLRRSRDEVFHGFHKTIRQRIARSEREQMCYEEGRSEDLLQKFYSLLLLTRRRHQIPPQPLIWFRNLIACLGNSLKIRVASAKDGTPVASIITLSFKKVITYKYSCSNPQFKTQGGTVFLLWRTIQEAMDEGASELDMGRSDYETPGLISFKGYWGASRYELVYYTHPALGTQSTNRILAAAGRRMVTALPDRIFAALGRLLYRHAG